MKGLTSSCQSIVKLSQIFHGALPHGWPYLDGKRPRWW